VEADEVALVRAVADGDRASLAQLYDRYAPSLMAVGCRILGERREAEDLLHDVFIEVWQKAAGFDPQRGSVRAWLVMRTRSRARDRKKSAGSQRLVSLEERRAPEEASPGEDPLFGPDRKAVRSALSELP
jgi:RNA polymerase sigma-70 factor (ECF subfamily)